LANIKSLPVDIPADVKASIIRSFVENKDILKLLIATVENMDFDAAETIFINNKIKNQILSLPGKVTTFDALRAAVTDIIVRSGIPISPGMAFKANIKGVAKAAMGKPFEKIKPVVGMMNRDKDLTVNGVVNAFVPYNIVANLKFIDSKRKGVGRIIDVEVPLNVKQHLFVIGKLRYDTILVRTLIFLINSYRLMMFKLRRDTKDKHSVIATAPGDILDDNDTEFYGFDQY
jgi:hypothetical protein